MQQTVSREKQKLQDQQPSKAEPSARHFSARGISEESHFHDVGEVSVGFLGVTYERFLQMPVPVVLTVLWFLGMALLSSFVLMLYTFGTLLASVAPGG